MLRQEILDTSEDLPRTYLLRALGRHRGKR